MSYTGREAVSSSHARASKHVLRFQHSQHTRLDPHSRQERGSCYWAFAFRNRLDQKGLPNIFPSSLRGGRKPSVLEHSEQVMKLPEGCLHKLLHDQHSSEAAQKIQGAARERLHRCSLGPQLK